MIERTKQILPVTILMLMFCFSISAQGTKPQSNPSSAATTTNVSNTTTSSDRELDGYVGPVRRVKTEVAKLTNKGGKFVEGARALLENAAYNINGVKSEYSYFPNAVTAVDPTGRETYKYDEKGNISEMVLYNTDGSLAKKEVYIYDYDFLSNWTKMTTSVAVIEGGKLSYEPTEVTYRTISYYMDETVLKQMEAAQKAADAKASNTTAATSQPQPTPTTTQTQSAPQTPTNNEAAKTNASNANHVVQNNTQSSTPNNSSTENKPLNAESKPNNNSSAASVEKKPGDSATQVKIEPANNSAASNQTTPNSTASNSTAVNTEVPKAAPRMLKPISGGVLNGKAIKLPMPDYPDFAKRSRVSGLVIIEVVIDENGKVISAKAVSGPAMLQQAAVNAALLARFSPTLLSGQPVKVTGTINYNFTLQ